ncbi:DeoR/GlpR family DNA-binding transcription regulator [Vibrio campbellii]|uniref:DeoR/GlpR family DNA-binding transcription regulator n=1 Tax=Vibrio campbellii TaxID=680 RepID=UPI000CD37A95|nr:DeoR/GlpR family DNA-binding transcription regulator [Vibrio campbellii]AUW06665.1 DeoR/GlpR transcriptional regulator [Vibrio campbellii]MCC4222571.1 DeoR/GlpR family DNA-binding transcription regulator [Vibrio campbellii]MCE7729086.1 DeoR/GlpR family DNA-binding transcription regulator [Vibrio campbellii]
MNNLNVRQQSIIELVHQQEYCSIEELAQRFEVTTQTIRRDINQLCQLGLTRRHHGGVGLPATLSNRSYASRQVTNQQEKQTIADEVVKAIPNGSTLFLGIGTTIALIAERLANHSELRVVTNNFEAAHILSHFENIETWIPGGRIRTNDRDVVDGSAELFYGQFSADIGIIGCAGVTEILQSHSDMINLGSTTIDTQSFAMEHELREAKVSQAILANSEQKWLVANNSKWQRRANTKVAPLSYFDRVFSN